MEALKVIALTSAILAMTAGCTTMSKTSIQLSDGLTTIDSVEKHTPAIPFFRGEVHTVTQYACVRGQYCAVSDPSSTVITGSNPVAEVTRALVGMRQADRYAEAHRGVKTTVGDTNITASPVVDATGTGGDGGVAEIQPTSTMIEVAGSVSESGSSIENVSANGNQQTQDLNGAGAANSSINSAPSTVIQK